MLAVALAVVAVGPCLPARMARAAMVLAIVLAVVIWLAEGLGGLFTGGGTDPNSGPLLVLLAVAFWPAAPSPAVAGSRRTESLRTESLRYLAGRSLTWAVRPGSPTSSRP